MRSSTARGQQFLDEFVRRAAQTDCPLLAVSLKRYAEAENLTWEELAESLSGSVNGLNHVAACRPPRPDHFVEDVQAIAGGRVDPDLLLLLLRRLQVLHVLSTLDTTEALEANSDDSGLLMAARDREE